MESKPKSTTRRALLKSGTATVATLSVAPTALAGTPTQIAPREIVLQFDVTPGLAKGTPAPGGKRG